MIPPLLVLRARAEARAILYAAGEYDSIAQAVAPLLNDAQGLAETLGSEAVHAAVHGPFELVAREQ
jgi:hypothetical protein